MPLFPSSDDFFLTLKKRVDDHFRSLRIDRKHSLVSYIRYFFTIICIWSLYWLQWSLSPDSFWMFYLISMAHGISLAQYCVSAVHDGSHGAIGHNPVLWKLLVIGHDFFNGCSGTLW